MMNSSIYQKVFLLFQVKLSLPIGLIALSLLIPFTIFGQIDSLEQKLEELPQNTNKVDLLNELSYAYHSHDIKQTFAYANEALALASQLGYSKGKAYAFHYLSVANGIGGNNDLSKQFNTKAIHLADSLELKSLLIRVYNAKGLINDKAGNIEISIQVYQKALDLAILEQDWGGITTVCLNAGTIHSRNKDFIKARSYFERAITAAQKANNQGDVAWGYRCIAMTFFKEKKYAKATPFFEKSLKFAKEVNDTRSISFTLGEFAKNHFEMGKKELAEKYALESVRMIKVVGDNEGLMISLYDLMDMYLKMNQPNKAILAGKEALAKQEDVNNIHLQLDIQELIAEGHAQKQEFKIAYEVKELVQAGRDSLEYAKKINLVAELEEKYQSKKKEAENALLRIKQQHQVATIKQQKSINIFLATVGVLLALLGYMTFNAYKSKQQNNLLLEAKVRERTKELQLTNKQLVQSNEELARFAYAASHDLREPLRNITNFTILLHKKLASTLEHEILEMMNMIKKNAEHMNKLILDTLEFTRLSDIEGAKEAVDLNQTIKNIELSISNTLTKKNAHIELLKPLPVVQANDSLLFSVFKNLIENGITYNESSTPNIKIDYNLKGKNYVFSVADNGIGIRKAYQHSVFELFKRLQNREKYPGSGLGLANCKKIIDKLGGKIWVESDGQDGSTFFFTLPYYILE